ncbi:MBL fold metallo-hydrolase [Arcanobacterium haemolyticum]|uniref:Beta-lactamase domain protein n=1 Tax=Arcanobacterium haemolyticum (strain ATCC 9345 / DSM 20595 / CCM 5947 / CCUG 17215 / LMG 16163 / NBRC 15585 / NCTC 8452 / 11018) TaxID=644284 RepID=D7BK80_ARCHD|nr:MBL fold metallo-hydrolase [Arcanobacterium haemolyticum]ADH93060.1 beta-lactamase domain protein [Arcanobacterium haemolyticum DSM 20595]SQH28182.1 hydroxyacylglutathione hydrolase [Arcanobacterium haemolyticum]
MVTIERYIVGAWEANCYLLTSQDETLVIDPGAQPGLLLPILKNHNVKAIVATHGHSDHIGAINEIRSEYLCPVFIGKDDAEMARNPIYSGFADEGSSYRVTDCEFVTEGSLITVGEEVLSVIETPGHTPGSLCLFNQKNALLFTGDTLFRNGIGSTAFVLGDTPALIASLGRLGELPGNTTVLPGHGESTTIGEEKIHNIYLNGSTWHV